MEELRAILPPCLKGAPGARLIFNGELLLNKRPGCRVIFGRKSEEKTFGFQPGKFYILLRIWHPCEKKEVFEPLYMVIWRGAEVFLHKLGIAWSLGREQDTLVAKLMNVERWDDLPVALQKEVPELEGLD